MEIEGVEPSPTRNFQFYLRDSSVTFSVQEAYSLSLAYF
ncbi:hypothetical protein FFONT_0022 [Fervidicoccus fontis Kam940]|uniref:Uncharacterized protein n=1 Tax=Fervidicoccus fontis (strain DSM 19380 / JCM 18336 / VKM B-2539 / Kam940) TaxID=1163730 RepID=H9ZZ61_FERFK|nr:hypothetical protein FFONT_0022 [Fervidicoccus fontis Kam940]